VGTDNTDQRDQVRVFVCGSCDGSATLVEALAQEPAIELVGVAPTAADAVGTLAGGHLATVLLATGAQELPADELAVVREHTRAPILVLSSGESARLLEQALDADVADVLLLPQLTENVVFAIRKAAHAGRRLTGATLATTHGRIVTVFSPKGGTGKTVLATNLAASLAKHEGKRTLLLDLDLQFGDAAIMLGLKPDKTIYDLVSAPGELDPEKLAGYTTKHASGLDILPAPLRPEDAELVTEAKIGRLLEVARSSYDLIVVDTSPFFHGPMLATLDQTDELLLLASLDVPTLKNVRLSLQTLELLSFPMKKVRVVLNRANSKVGMKEGEVETALEHRIAFRVPSEGAVPLSVNRGFPISVDDPSSAFSREVRGIAKALAHPAPAQPGKKRKFLSRAA
jgi:pilus assembly protein CpaE